MSRYIDLTRTPEKAGDKQCGTYEVIEHCINTDKRFNTHGAGLKASNRVDIALRKSKDRKLSYVEIDSESWDMLVEALDRPVPLEGWHAYPLQPARKLLPFIGDVKDAKEEKPEEAAEKQNGQPTAEA